MADLPESNSTRGVPAAQSAAPADPPLLVVREFVSFLSSILLMLPVSLFSGYVTGGTVSILFFVLSMNLLGGRTIPVAELVSVVAGFLSGGLTFFYFALQLNSKFCKARLRGQLNVYLPTRCPACQTALVVGQVLCAGCGKDLRDIAGAKQPALDLRRLALWSFALATVPLANAALVIVALVSVRVLNGFSSQYSEGARFGALACALAAAGGVILLRVPRALVLWRLLNAEGRESGADSQREIRGPKSDS